MLTVNNLSKSFLIPHQRRTTLKENFVDFFRPNTYEKFKALEKISFQIKKGEFVGIVGPNGSGKSTLLKILASIYQPDSGQIQINGRLAPLLELGIGFKDELSARENIFISGALLGLSNNQIKQRFNHILEFAGIAHFIDLKLKNFSSGMRQRLAFAIAAQVDADIYLCDEVFAVGDELFQQKCLDTFKLWQAEGKTIILVSHNSSLIEQYCDQAIFLLNGQIQTIGPARQAIAAYNRYQAQQNIQRQVHDFSHTDLHITRLEFLDQRQQPGQSFLTGSALTIRLHYQSQKTIKKPVFGLAIHKSDGTHLTGPNTKTSAYLIPEIKPGNGHLDCHIPNLNLLAGEYLVSASAFDYTCTIPFDYLDKQFSFTVEKNRDNQYGLVDLSVSWLLESNPPTAIND
ncbi:ABC transporter ATP-binding protein [Candidatus Peregrinibacteria bacterium]|nr:ABC transporter ATP-binding protein [Candidatus Peregrinibacteria bacterium]